MTERSAWCTDRRVVAAPPPVTLVTVPGLHGSEGAHWQSWL